LSRAVESPLVRGGLVISAGLITGNLIGFFRVALTAYLLGTHSAADALAVAIGPIDTLNGVLTNTMIFAFVPMLTEREDVARTALFRKLNQVFIRVFFLLAFLIVVCAPWLIRLLAPGLDANYVGTAVTILRIVSISSLAAGAAALYSAFLFTHRRFAATAFNQASLNVCTIVAALSLWRLLGVYGFAIGYTVGAWVQLGIVYFAARSSLQLEGASEPEVHWRDLLTKPGSFLLYAVVLALNVIVTRAYATHAGPGMAAALDYSMRCLTVPLAYLINPVSNSLLPEIARLRSGFQLRQAFRLIDKTIAMVALAAVAGCAVGITPRAVDPADVRARQLHRAIHATGFRRIFGICAKPDRLEPAGADFALAVCFGPPLVAVARGSHSGDLEPCICVAGEDAGTAMDRCGSFARIPAGFLAAVHADADQSRTLAGRGGTRFPTGARAGVMATMPREVRRPGSESGRVEIERVNRVPGAPKCGTPCW
jgi:hypothetical protein